MADPAITVRGLRKSIRRSNEAVRGIDFEVAPGEVFGFLGPNGAGKTTTDRDPRGLSGAHRRAMSRSSASIPATRRASGAPGSAWSSRNASSTRCSRSPRRCASTRASSRRRARWTRPSSWSASARSAGHASALSPAGSSDGSTSASGSSGTPSCSSSTSRPPGFDPSARRGAWNMIEGLKELGTTIVLTTHYMDEAQHLADRVVIMREGGIVAEGAPETLGEQLGRETMIRFRTYDGIADRVSAAIGSQATVSGNEATIASTDPAARPLPAAAVGGGRGDHAAGPRGPAAQPGGRLPRGHLGTRRTGDERRRDWSWSRRGTRSWRRSALRGRCCSARSSRSSSCSSSTRSSPTAGRRRRRWRATRSTSTPTSPPG